MLVFSKLMESIFVKSISSLATNRSSKQKVIFSGLSWAKDVSPVMHAQARRTDLMVVWMFFIVVASYRFVTLNDALPALMT